METKRAKIGNKDKKPICRHIDEVAIREIHPTWRVQHAASLPQYLTKPTKMMKWGKDRNMERNLACNYVGCAKPKANVASVQQERDLGEEKLGLWPAQQGPGEDAAKDNSPT